MLLLRALVKANSGETKDRRTDHAKMEPFSRFELEASPLPRGCSTPELEGLKCGAGGGIRTRDPQLGRLMLYQLSYSRAIKIYILGVGREGFEPP